MNKASLSTLLTFLLGNWEVILLIILFIYGWRQRKKFYWLTHRKELYDRRLDIYYEIEKILSLMFRNRKVSLEDLSMLLSNTAEAKNLFDRKIPKYIDEVNSHGVKLGQAATEYRDLYQEPPPPDYDHNKIVKQLHEQSTWAFEEHKKLPDKFKNYLNIS